MSNLPLSSPPRGPEPLTNPGKDTPPWWAGELSAPRRDELLDYAAAWVVAKGLEAPALMFLEMHKPLTTLAAVGYAMTQPPLMLFFGLRRTEELRLLLSDRDNVEALMQRIERFSKARPPSRDRKGAVRPLADARGSEAARPAEKKAGEP